MRRAGLTALTACYALASTLAASASASASASAAASALGDESPNLPFADTHIHLTWDQKELTTAKEVVEQLDEAGVGFAVVSGTPSVLALELAGAVTDAHSVQILPMFSPYTHPLGKRDWHRNPDVVDIARAGLERGDYIALGEIHFMSGFKPWFDNAVFLGLMSLAETYNVPALIHIDSGNEQHFIELCSAHSEVDIVFAHAGGNLTPLYLPPIFKACPRVWMDLSARDPWRYGGLTDAANQLLPEWREVMVNFPDRFIVGTDPVWRVTRTQSWDQADDGWDYFEQLIAWHRGWLNTMPEDVEQKIRLENAEKIYQRALNNKIREQ